MSCALLAAAALAGWLKVRCARDTAWVAPPEDPYYRRDLALVHHRGFGFHARACAPGCGAAESGTPGAPRCAAGTRRRSNSSSNSLRRTRHALWLIGVSR